MCYGPTFKIGFDVFHNLRKSGQGFKRHPGHRVKSGLVAVALLSEWEDHNGCRTFPIDNHFAGLRNLGLSNIHIQKVQSPAMQDAFDHIQLPLIGAVGAASAKLGQGRFGDVVVCGAEASCNNDYLIVFQFILQ